MRVQVKAGTKRKASIILCVQKQKAVAVQCWFHSSINYIKIWSIVKTMHSQRKVLNNNGFTWRLHHDYTSMNTNVLTCGMAMWCASRQDRTPSVLASYPGLLTPAFVTYSTNTEEGLVRLMTCSDIYLDVGGICGGVTHSQKTASECVTERNHRPYSD